MDSRTKHRSIAIGAGSSSRPITETLRPMPPLQTTTRPMPAAQPCLTSKEEVSANELVQLARKAFSQKDFPAAYQFLSRALSIAPGDINLLDSRAATLEKLRKLDDALADAKSMIKLHTTNPKGYLRAGKILRIQLNLKSSIKAYTTGLERCDKGINDYETLIRLAAEATAKQEEMTKRQTCVWDPVERLPFELVMMVFDLLTFRERCRCLRVSKKWTSYLGSIRNLWQSIDMTRKSSPPSHARYLPPKPDGSINSLISNRSVLSVAKFVPPKTLKMGGAQSVTGVLFTQLTKMRRAGALQELSLRKNSKIFDRELSLFWSATPKLQSLDLHDSPGVTDAAVISLLSRCTLLEELDVSECPVTEACVMTNLCKPVLSLKKLTFGRYASSFSREGVEAMATRFPNLVTLDIRSLRPRGIEALESISQLTHLKHLYTDSVDTTGEEMTNHVMQRWVQGIPNLESLQMTVCKGVSDTTLRLIAVGPQGTSTERRGWSHSLKMLNLSLSPYLTSEGVSFLAENPLVQLHTLVLNGCSRLGELGLRTMLMGSGGEICHLEFAGNGTTSDKLMGTLADYCPKLEMVNLAHSGQVTGVGLMKLVDARGDQLQFISVDGCHTIGADAVDRARTVLGGPSRVSFKFTQRSF